MAKTKRTKTPLQVPLCLKFEWFPVKESSADFQKRKDLIQQLLIEMVMKTHQAGRPKHAKEEGSYAT